MAATKSETTAAEAAPPASAETADDRIMGPRREMDRLAGGFGRDKIEAQFDKGILTLTLPKTKEAQKRSRKIAVKAK